MVVQAVIAHIWMSSSQKVKLGINAIQKEEGERDTDPFKLKAFPTPSP